MNALWTLLLLAATPLLASAQTLQSVKVEPANPRVGEPVTITVSLDVSQGMNCGLRLHYGDGQQEDVKINQAQDAVFTRQHRYAQAGNYTFKAEPKTQLPVLKCLGRNQEARLTVAPASATTTAPGAQAAAPAMPAAASTPCPGGWALEPKGQNKKTGAFTCTARPGSPAPAERLACPGSLGYYENLKKGQIGCRP